MEPVWVAGPRQKKIRASRSQALPHSSFRHGIWASLSLVLGRLCAFYFTTPKTPHGCERFGSFRRHSSSKAVCDTSVVRSAGCFFFFSSSRVLSSTFVSLFLPCRNSDSGSHRRQVLLPPPTIVRALEGIFIARRLRTLLSSSTGIESRLPTYTAS